MATYILFYLYSTQFIRSMMNSMNFNRSDFPNDFVFGTATSAYQIEGHSFGNAGQTHWDSFAATPGNVARGEHGAVACDHYHRFEEDLDLIAAANLDCYSFSTSWARVLPEGRGKPNQEGLDFYNRLIDGILERGIKPKVTLYHWELPQPLADLGGWCNADMPNWFADFTHTVMSLIGDRVWGAAPINEPWCVGWLSHFLGIHAPGKRDIRSTARAMHHILCAHGRSIEVMRSLGMKNLGAVCNFEYAIPADDSVKAQAAADLYDQYYNQFFVSGMFHKCYPNRILEAFEPHLPAGWQNDFSTISTPLDWLGVNYYTCKRLASCSGLWPSHIEVEGPLPKTTMGWEIYPRGLYHFLTWLHQNYSGNLPLYVTENGRSSDDSVVAGEVLDTDRIDYISAHVQQVQKAMFAGVPVKGYMVWSMLDNYEWSLGYEKRFGLVHVDFDTFKRTPKNSYKALQNSLSRA